MSDDSRMVKDPICGKDVDTLRARAVGIFGGVTYYFCSQECKSKYVDPRKEMPATPPRETGERRQAEKLPAGVRRQPAPAEKQPQKQAEAEAESAEPVRYAHSRMRRVTGEVSTPVVQIDLSPNKKPAPASPPAADAEEPLEPVRSSRGWAWIAIVMLILAGGVIFFTLKHR